jgi:hypothetical protein
MGTPCSWPTATAEMPDNKPAQTRVLAQGRLRKKVMRISLKNRITECVHPYRSGDSHSIDNDYQLN